MGIWLDQLHEDFLQPPELPCLRLLLAYIQVNVPGSSLEHQAQLLCSELKNFEPPEAEMEGKDNCGENVTCKGQGPGQATQRETSKTGLGQNT